VRTLPGYLQRPVAAAASHKNQQPKLLLVQVTSQDVGVMVIGQASKYQSSICGS
jgi:hypothetical protein